MSSVVIPRLPVTEVNDERDIVDHDIAMIIIICK